MLEEYRDQSRDKTTKKIVSNVNSWVDNNSEQSSANSGSVHSCIILINLWPPSAQQNGSTVGGTTPRSRQLKAVVHM